MKRLRVFFSPAMVLKEGVWSNVVSDGIMRMGCMQISRSWEILGGWFLLLEFIWGRWWVLEEDASQDMCLRTGRERRVGMFVFNRKWHILVSPVITRLKC